MSATFLSPSFDYLFTFNSLFNVAKTVIPNKLGEIVSACKSFDEFVLAL